MAAPTPSYACPYVANCNCGCEQGYSCDCLAPCFNPSLIQPYDGYDDWNVWDANYLYAMYPDYSWGVWMPEAPLLFRPFIADPRQLTYSAAWRFDDDLFGNNSGPVSFGDVFTFYRWYNPCGYRGVMQIDLEGGVFAIFQQTEFSSPLVNADYYVAIPISYLIDDWSFRLRLYHISSHIGDEYLLFHHGFNRRNISSEYVDFSVAYQPNFDTRLYFVLGDIVRSDPEFPLKHLYFQYGAELYFSELGYYSSCNELLGRPFAALNILQREDNDYHLDRTLAVGYEWMKLTGTQRRFRIFCEYHAGFSAEGQFCENRTSYLEFGISYGY